MKPNISASDCVLWYWSYINASAPNHTGTALTKLVMLTWGQRSHPLLHMTSVTLRPTVRSAVCGGFVNAALSL